MTTEADRFWENIAPKYRAVRGLCPMTPEEADSEYDESPAIPLTKFEIQSIVDAVMYGNSLAKGPYVKDWTPDAESEAAKDEMLALYRDEGELDPQTDAIEDDLRKSMLSDEPAEDQDGMDDGTAPSKQGEPDGG